MTDGKIWDVFFALVCPLLHELEKAREKRKDDRNGEIHCRVRVIFVGFPIESSFDMNFPSSIFCANSFTTAWNPLSIVLVKVHSDFPLPSISPHNHISRGGPKDVLIPKQAH